MKLSCEEMLFLKSEGDTRSSSLMVESADTVVWKYSFHKDIFDQDDSFVMYRAGGVHLWLTEIYTYCRFVRNHQVQLFTSNAWYINYFE